MFNTGGLLCKGKPSRGHAAMWWEEENWLGHRCRGSSSSLLSDYMNVPGAWWSLMKGQPGDLQMGFLWWSEVC